MRKERKKEEVRKGASTSTQSSYDHEQKKREAKERGKRTKLYEGERERGRETDAMRSEHTRTHMVCGGWMEINITSITDRKLRR